MHRISKLVGHLQSEAPPSPSSLSSKETAQFLLENKSENKSGYLYTMDGHADKVFSREQRDKFERDGFVVIKGHLSPDEVAYFYNRFTELVENPSLRVPNMAVMRDVSLAKLDKAHRKDTMAVTKLQNWSRDPGLWKYAVLPQMVACVGAFCGEDIRAMHFMSINKPSDSGSLSSRHPIHQDQWYFPFGPSAHIVAAWTALEKCHRRNGCLAVIPGSHKNAPGGRLIRHDYPEWTGPVNHSYHAVQVKNVNAVIRKRVHLEMDPGDTVFFHPLLLHCSGANLTGSSRRSISTHFASSTLCTYHDFEEAGQKKIAEDVQDIARKSLKIDKAPPFSLIWATKSRQVRGNEGNLSLDACMKHLRQTGKFGKTF